MCPTRPSPPFPAPPAQLLLLVLQNWTLATPHLPGVDFQRHRESFPYLCGPLPQPEPQPTSRLQQPASPTPPSSPLNNGASLRALRLSRRRAPPRTSPRPSPIWGCIPDPPSQQQPHFQHTHFHTTPRLPAVAGLRGAPRPAAALGSGGMQAACSAKPKGRQQSNVALVKKAGSKSSKCKTMYIYIARAARVARLAKTQDCKTSRCTTGCA